MKQEQLEKGNTLTKQIEKIKNNLERWKVCTEFKEPTLTILQRNLKAFDQYQIDASFIPFEWLKEEMLLSLTDALKNLENDFENL